MTERYPDYDVLAKRNTPSWNAATRRVLAERLAVSRVPRFLSEDAFATLDAVADRIVPQPAERERIPVAALIDDKLARDRADGYRHEHMPWQREAWTRGLQAIEAESEAAHGRPFRALDGASQDSLLRAIEAGQTRTEAWGGMPPQEFWKTRLLTDIVHAYWSHPTAWSEMGWGGPASPRGYVRMGYDERDPWEAAEASPGREAEAARKNRRVG